MGWSGTGAKDLPSFEIIGAAQDGGPGKDADRGGHDQGTGPSGEDASHHQNYP